MERWQSEGVSHRQIAALLGKSPQTINNEIKRGLVRQQVRKGKFERVYRADTAQATYEENKSKSVRPVTLTKELKERIVHYWIHHGHLGIAPS
ncbi:Transposase [Streptococcus pluranimalium]